MTKIKDFNPVSSNIRELITNRTKAFSLFHDKICKPAYFIFYDIWSKILSNCAPNTTAIDFLLTYTKNVDVRSGFP